MNAQDLKSHQWKDRLLLVISKSEKDTLFQEQIKILEQKQNELQDRKLVVYQITAEAFKTEFVRSSDWIKSTSLFDNFSGQEIPFKIILIGLDGGIKLEQNELLSVDTLFNTIDSMPMRRTELLKRNQKD
jgi:hypothetical protein